MKNKMKREGQAAGQRGSVLPLVICILLLFFSLMFGLWAFSGRQDYKNNSDKKVADAVKVAKQQQQLVDTQAFNEAAKQPLKPYTGPVTYGSLSFKYPKTWSAYITTDDRSTTPVDGYFYPDYIPSLQTTSFALRIQVLSSSYTAQMQTFNSAVTAGKVKVSAFTAAKVPGALGSKVEGTINGNQEIMVLFPLRDKTIKLWTEATSFDNDFINNILPSVTFSP